MAMIGHVVLLRTGLASGILKLTTSTSMPQVFTRQLTMFVGIVSPSVVWYTSWLFVRSGGVYLYRGSLRYSGYIGYKWSRSAVAYSSATSASSYWFEFTASESRPSHGPNDRWYGFPVRCLV